MSQGYQQRGSSHRVNEASALDAAISATNADYEIARLKIEDESMRSECRIRPRDDEEIMRSLAAKLKAYPSLAYESVYNKPVGKVLRISCKCGHAYEISRKGKGGWPAEKCGSCGRYAPASSQEIQKYARGLSVRAAEALAAAYKYNCVRTQITPVNATTVRVDAVYTDYHDNRKWEDSGILSRVYKGSDGTPYTIPDDRFLGLICKAEASRRVREAILRCIDPGLKEWYEDQCEKIIDATLGPEHVEKIITKFSEFNVTLAMLESRLGRTKISGWTKANHRTLLADYTAIRDGETTVDAIFFPQREQEDEAEQDKPDPFASEPTPIEQKGGDSASNVAAWRAKPSAPLLAKVSGLAPQLAKSLAEKYPTLGKLDEANTAGDLTLEGDAAGALSQAIDEDFNADNAP